jgi:hypothetical protein
MCVDVPFLHTEVCPKSPFRAKEFLPGGVHYNLNPREVFRGPPSPKSRDRSLLKPPVPLGSSLTGDGV